MKPNSPENFFDADEVTQIEESEQTFNLEDKAGLQGLQKHLMSMRNEDDSALAVNLEVNNLDWPEAGKNVLKTFRFNYSDLLRKLSEVIGQDDVVSDGDADEVSEMYEEFLSAQSAFIDYQETYLAEGVEEQGQEDAPLEGDLVEGPHSSAEEVGSDVESDEDLAGYKAEVLKWVEKEKEEYFGAAAEDIYADFKQQIQKATTPLEVSQLFSALDTSSSKKTSSEPSLSDPVEPVVLKNPEAASETAIEDIADYKQSVTQELVSFLKDQKYEGIKTRLAKSIDLATTKKEVDRIRQNIINSPEWASEKDVVDQDVVVNENLAPFQLTPELRVEEQATASGADIEAPEVAEKSLTLEEQFSVAKQSAEKLATQTESIYATITQKFPRGRRTQEVIDQINRLQNINRVAEDMLSKVTELQDSSEDEPVKLQALKNYQKTAEKTQAGLQQWLENEGLNSTEAAPEVVPEVPPLPSEVEVVGYAKRLKNPFYTEEDRETATALLQNYYEAVAQGKSAEIIQQAFKNFVNNVEELDTHPNVNTLTERVAKIEERVQTLKDSEPELVMSINSMKEQFEEAANQPKPDEARMLSTYKVIEKLALDTEQMWFTVCGMRLPKAGPEGVFGARSFREGLVLARDRHKDLVGHPEKQKLVDEIIGKLWRVPEQGISEETLAQITQLAHQVDTTGSVVGNSAQPEINSVEKEPAATAEVADGLVDGSAEDSEQEKAKETESLDGEDDIVSDEAEIPQIDEPESIEDMWLSSDVDSSRRGKLAINSDEADVAIPIRNVQAEQPVSVEERDGADVENSFSAGISAPPLSREARRNEKGILSKYASAEQLRLVRELDQDSSDNIENDLNNAIKSEINRIERKGERLGWFSSMVNEPTESVFEVLKEKSVKEVTELFGEYSAANRNELLQDYKISYENLSAWKDEFDDLQNLVTDRFKINPNSLTFGQLVVQANIARMINLNG